MKTIQTTICVQFLFFLFYSTILFAQAGQNTRLDWKLHDVGQVRQLITNMGTEWKAQTDYPGLIYCEYPLNSNEEHIGEGGIWIGAISQGDTLVSASSVWANPRYEFYPGGSLDDTIWIVKKDLKIHIPYWKTYSAVSDQDFICKYTDYNILNIGDHKPLYLDIIQTSYAWSSAPLDEIIVYNYNIIPVKNDLQDVYFGFWLDGNVGYRAPGWGFALDDLSLYDHDLNMAIAYDPPIGEDGEAYSPIGIKIYPPEYLDPESLEWTFNWYAGGSSGSVPADRDPELYQQMSNGIIMPDQTAGSGSQFVYSFGPFDLSQNDTFKVVVGQVLGMGLKGLSKNAGRLDWLVSRKFQVPSAPPAPPLRVEIDSRKVILRWDVQPGDINPEEYKDPNRADSSANPFEGYRVYKSTQSSTGPWSLLAEYDEVDNVFNHNLGLEYEYVDEGLLDNFEYYYSVTSFSKPDTISEYPTQESSLSAGTRIVIPGTAAPEEVGKVAVVPNPYRGDIAYHQYNPPWERIPRGRNWMEQDRQVMFINLPSQCEIKIYTVAGDIVATLEHNNYEQGFEKWNLTSSVGQAVASGIYLFSVENLTTGRIQIGKFVIIK